MQLLQDLTDINVGRRYALACPSGFPGKVEQACLRHLLLSTSTDFTTEQLCRLLPVMQTALGLTMAHEELFLAHWEARVMVKFEREALSFTAEDIMRLLSGLITVDER